MGINKSKYSFRSYKFWYPLLFSLEKQRILRIFPKAHVEHIGSTSIPKLGGKGIIDILVGLESKNWKNGKKDLIINNYFILESSPGKNRLSFRKIYGKLFLKRVVHVHLVKFNSFSWKEPLKFKRKLLRNYNLIKEYSKIKKGAVKIAKGDGEKYRMIKHDFIKENSK